MAEKAVVEKLKENKYDDSVFFEKYSQMSRSQKGLEGAGEWQTLQKLLPLFHLSSAFAGVFCYNKTYDKQKRNRRDRNVIQKNSGRAL